MTQKVWEQRYNSKDTPSKTDVRNAWERDYARLIHSAAFRRLQSKTQVLGLGESDFYRTRLTHSMEVAQIGVGIIRWLEFKHQNDIEILNALAPPELMSTICLAHDIGHPPFGHGGEVALNACMRDYGGFEGNGQTLRILTKLEKYTEQDGMNPTRRMLLGVLKYPAPYSEVVQLESYGKVPTPHWLCKAKDQQPPKCYLDDEKNIVDFILEPLTEEERKEFTRVESRGPNKHKKTKYKGLDTSIMELADDISYSLHDLEDAIALGMVTRADWEEFFSSKEEKIILSNCGEDAEELAKNLFSGASHLRKKTIGRLIHKLIINIEVEDSDLPEATTSLVKWGAKMQDAPKALMGKIQDLVLNKVIKSPNVQQLEFKGQRLVMELFAALQSDPERLLPLSTKKSYQQLSGDKKAQMRVICDFIAGMTDEYATRFYEKLYYPHKGSIFDQM